MEGIEAEIIIAILGGRNVFCILGGKKIWVYERLGDVFRGNVHD